MRARSMRSTNCDVSLVFVGIIVAMGAASGSDQPCLAQSGPCKCATSAGDIDLKPLDNPSTPLNWLKRGSAWSYSYNPCSGIQCSTFQDTAVCEVFSNGGSYFKLGSASSAKFMYDVSTGRNYIDYSSDQYVVKVYLVCDPNQNGGITDGPDAPSGYSYATFTLTSKYNCPAATPPQAPAPAPAGLSIGSILLIVFFSVLLVYLVGGALFLHFVKHESGKEMVPNYGFWATLPALIADGCVLTYRSAVSLICRRGDSYSSI